MGRLTNRFVKARLGTGRREVQCVWREILSLWRFRAPQQGGAPLFSSTSQRRVL